MAVVDLPPSGNYYQDTKLKWGVKLVAKCGDPSCEQPLKKGDIYLHVVRKEAIEVDSKGKIIKERVKGLNQRIHVECIEKYR